MEHLGLFANDTTMDVAGDLELEEYKGLGADPEAVAPADYAGMDLGDSFTIDDMEDHVRADNSETKETHASWPDEGLVREMGDVSSSSFGNPNIHIFVYFQLASLDHSITSNPDQHRWQMARDI
jgi:hypothetical protein